MDESMETSVAEPSTPSQVDETLTSETPSQTSQAADTSQETTPNKRWNLRTRKPKQPDVSTQEEDEETSSPTTAPPSSSKPSASSSAAGATGQRKRGGAPVKTPAAKRKSAGPTSASSRTKTTTIDVTPGSKKGGDNMATVMFNSVMGGRSALKSLASDWVDGYQEDPESAMVELIQFFVLCCGCKARISLDMFREDTSNVIRTLTENFAEESGEYPLIMTGPLNKKFKHNFSELIRHVVMQCKHSIIYDEYMLDTLIVWLVGFTDSQVRAFRHTCTMACMKLVSSLVEVANYVNAELDNTQRQVEAERKRQLEKRTEVGQAKLEKLVSKRGELQQNKSELEDTMKGLFSSVFVHRYKDVRPEIRVACIAELGIWMMKYGVKFLADSYLKYIGWMLYDKVGDVRLASLQVLESLYASSDTAPHLELFTERFKSRLLSMRLDVDESAAVTAIEVLGHMHSLDLLDSEDSLEVCELLFLENRAISHAAGQFAVGYLFSDDFMTRAKQKKVLSGRKKPSDGEIKLTELIKFFCEVKIHDHASYFVDSLWDYTDVLKDWNSMTQLLLDEKCGIVLNSEEEAVLIEVMACAVRRAVGATPPAGRAKGKMLSNKEKRAMEECKEELSEHLMVTLPQLMAKFGSDSGNAANLANIPQHFDLELYAENRLQKNLEDLLTHLHQLTVKHIEPAVLDECAKSFRHLVDPEFSLHSTADIAFHKLVDELVQNFKQYYTEYKDSGDQDEEEAFSLEVAITRLTSYFKVMKIPSDQFSEEFNELLALGVNGECPEKILENVVMCLKLEIMWAMHGLEQAANPERTVMRDVHSKLLSLFKSCVELVKFGSGRGQREAYVTFTDLLVVFAKQLRKNAQLASLVYVPDAQLQTALQEYVLEHVVNSADDDEDNEPTTDEEALIMAERLNDRRVLMAAFLKLCMFSVVDMKLAAPLWEQYIRQYHNFGDLIKLSMNRCREANPMMWYKTVVETLKGAFLAHLEENGGAVDQASIDWTEMRELAKKFALSLGFDAMKDNVRQPLVRIHRDGVVFALSRPEDEEDHEELDPPPYIDFLIILSEFSHRVLLQDRTGTHGLVPFLLKHSPSSLVKKIGSEERLGVKGWEGWWLYYQATQPQTLKGRKPTAAAANRKRIMKDSFLSARPTKVARVEATPPTQSEQGSEMSDVGSTTGTPPPAPPTVTKATRGRTTRRAQATAPEN